MQCANLLNSGLASAQIFLAAPLYRPSLTVLIRTGSGIRNSLSSQTMISLSGQDRKTSFLTSANRAGPGWFPNSYVCPEISLLGFSLES